MCLPRSRADLAPKVAPARRPTTREALPLTVMTGKAPHPLFIQLSERGMLALPAEESRPGRLPMKPAGTGGDRQMGTVGSIIHGAYGDCYEQMICLRHYKRAH